MPIDAQRIQTVFLAAAEIRDPAERAKFLDGACAGDAELKSRVEALLRAHDHPDSLLDHPAVAADDPDNANTRTIGHESGPVNDEIPLGFLAPATRSDSLGRIGHYEVLQVLGQGGFGIVFRAFDDVLQRVVAVKVLSPHMAATSPARKRFLREAQSSAQVRHENVVQVYEVGETPLPYLVMEFIPGETLQQRLDRIGPLDVSDILRIGRQIAEGLAAAHATDLIHRDIKPGNILLEGGQQRVKITDFGLARAADDASISQSGIIAGTPLFMAPEQAKGEHLDHRADLFSLGSVLYTMCAGRAPFRANTTLAVLKRVAEDTPRPIREVIPETPQWLCDIISKLHAKNPDDRFQSAREVADLLADCEAQLKENAKLKDFSRIPKSKPVAARSGRRWWVAAAILLLPVIALAVTESAGVTHLFRGQGTSSDPIKPGAEPTPGPVAKPEPLPPTYKNSIGMEFVLVPKGKSWLGGGKDRLGDKEVEIPADFYLSKYEVTQEEWTQVMGENPSYFSRTGGGKGAVKDIPDADLKRFPVENVSWEQCQLFVAKLNEREKETGWVYRLPKMTEWEYACRGPMANKADSAFDFYLAQPTSTLLPDQANFALSGLKRPCKVGSYNPNVLGLFDMHGNVAEWCEDNYTSAAIKILRGGCWSDDPGKCMLRFTGAMVAEGRMNIIGLRLARVPTDVPSPEAKTPEPVTPLAGTSPWTVLKPIEMKSEGGASLTLQPDDSILVSGKHPPNDSYTLTFRGLPATIQALRLEVQPHDSLPNKGPGRGASGEFTLTTIKTQLESPTKPGVPRVLKLTKAWADQSRGEDSREHLAIDEQDITGWVTEVGKPHFAVFEFAEPVAVPEGTVLRVTLEFKHPEQPQLELGCFRLSVVEDLSADRKAAEYVLSIGGIVRVDGGHEIKAVAELPKAPFRLASVGLTENKRVTDAGLAVFKDCKNLTELSLEGTPVTDAGLVHFKDFTNLTRLHLHFTAVGDAGLAHFKNCKGLTDIELRFTQVTDAGLAHLKDCKELSYLNLTNTPITDAGLVHLKDCTNLRTIALDLTRVTDAGLAHLKNCKNLTELILPGLPIGDDGLAHLKDCKNLTLLNLAETQRVTDAGLAHLAGLNELTELNLTNTKVTAKGVEALAKALPRCKITWTGGVIEAIDFDRKAAEYVLSKGGSVRVNGADTLIRAAANLPRESFRLTGLHLWNADGNQVSVTDAGLAVFKDCRNLTEILTYGTNLGAAGLAHFKDCKNLTLLSLEVSAVTDAGLAHFKDCKKLTFLRVTYAPVTDASLTHFKDCKKLTSLSLPATEVTDAGLAHLTGLDNLVELDLNGTKVTAKGVEGLAKALPKCKIYWNGAAVEPKPAAPAAPVADADRKAAEYALSVGGEIKVNEQGPVVKAVADLPREAFRLTWVGLPNNKQVTDAGLAAFTGCKNLGGLQLEGTPVTDAGLTHLKDCKGLTGLDLNNTKVTDAGLVHLKDCTNLTYLQLADTQATDAGLVNFKDCKNLMYLNLGRTQVGDAGLARLKECGNLTTLWLEGTPVTDTGLAHLTGLDKLIELKLAKTKVTAKGVEGLAKALPKCKITWDGATIEPR